jgi:hypothetical protein
MSDQQDLNPVFVNTDDRTDPALFRIDYQRLVNMLLPFTLRKHDLHLPLPERRHALLSWLHVLLAPVKRVYMEFLIYRHRVNYQMDHTGQVVYLEKVLNDRFDGAAERIRIQDGPKLDWMYLFRTDEKKPKYLKKIHLHNRLSYGDQGADFEVYIPADVPIWTHSGLMAECHSLINYYKLAGKTYQLIKQ